MARETAQVRSGYLFPDGSAGARPVCAVGSAAWFSWLEEGETFALLLPLGYRATVYRRRSGERHYWYASIKRHTKTYNKYVGKSDAATAERLADVGARLLAAAGVNGRVQGARPAPSAPGRVTAAGTSPNLEETAAAVAQALDDDLAGEVETAAPGFLFLSLGKLESGHLERIEDVLHAHGRRLAHWQARPGNDDTFDLSITTETI